MHTVVFWRDGDFLEVVQQGSPKPGHIERVKHQKNIGGNNVSEDTVITQRFLKINVRHITDGQGVVGGVLLVTPNAVMFDPNVSDPLVIEHGPESYGVIAPMDLVVNAAIFHDIAHMRIAGGESNQTDKTEIYFPMAFETENRQRESTCSPSNNSLLIKDETFSESGDVLLNKSCDNQESSSGSGREGGAFLKAFDGDYVKQEKSTEAKKTWKTDLKIEAGSDTDDDKNLTVSYTRFTLEEKRKSLLDHHWAIPSKDRSSDDECENNSNITVDCGACAQDHNFSTSFLSGVGAIDHLEHNFKESCFDSGIDIRDSISNVQSIPKKVVYSDADIVLSSDWVPPKTISPTNASESPPHISMSDGENINATISAVEEAAGNTLKKNSSVSFSVDGNEEQRSQRSQTQTGKASDKKNKMLKRLSYPLAWMEGLTGETAATFATGVSALGKSSEAESAPNTGDSNQSVFSKVFSRRSSIGTFMRPHSSEGTQSATKANKEKPQSQKLDYRSMVSVDDKPELFLSVDKLIPRPARACPDPPLYLRLRMGKPIGKVIPLPTSVMSYGKNKLRPEYWFSVPKNRVDELYRFINTWVAHLYGELDEEKIKIRGFQLIQDDTEWVKEGRGKLNERCGTGECDEINDVTRESWEVLPISTEEYKKASLFAAGSFDLDFPIPDLIGHTEILTEEHREKLCGHLPARAEGYSWSLVFCTSHHGFSLNSLYRKMQRLESPVLIVIQDTAHNVFGALTSCSMHVSDHFYGTGESFLYKFKPSFKVFQWTGENLYFIKGNVESLSIGAGDGRFGLWLDGDLNQGRSQTCSTYGNEPLAPQEDFVIKTLECWAFV